MYVRFGSSPLAKLFAPALLGAGIASCYSTGDGIPPPINDLYFPVGVQVSFGGSVLYVANSDFDLQYNGGTLQAYDLAAIRQDVVKIIENPLADGVPRFDDTDPNAQVDCANGTPTAGRTLGETCAPPVKSDGYVRDSAVIGAFATDLLLSLPPATLETTNPPVPAGNRSFDRLFMAVRGNASITWATIARDAAGSGSATGARDASYEPFQLKCSQDGDHRCGGDHVAGNDSNEAGNTRHITMPGEPFGMTFSTDGASLVVTHQTDSKTSLVATGLSRTDTSPSTTDNAPSPSLKFVVDNVPYGGIAIAAVPHDPDAFTNTLVPFPRPSFLETTRASAAVALLRQYPDQYNGMTSEQPRPFLDVEGAFPITIGPSSIDSRGIAIDPTPRLACKAKVTPANPTSGRSQADVDADLLACAQKPARVFIANRAPASLLVGSVGGKAKAEDPFDADRLVLNTSIPLSAGPSNVYLAPVVEADGALSLRVFVICFDSATLYIYNPETELLENIVRTGLGPFAMAFEPFSLADVAAHTKVDPVNGIRPYRFGYIASFTNSFIQVLDLDNAGSTTGGRSPTFETVVFTLGRPTAPKGS